MVWGELSRLPRWSQARPRAQDARGSAVEPEYRRAVARAHAMLSELQQGRRRIRKWCENEVTRVAPIQSRSQDHAERPTAAPARAALDRRAVLCLDAVATSAPGSLGVSPDRFSRLRAARGPVYPVQPVLRQVLEKFIRSKWGKAPSATGGAGCARPPRLPVITDGHFGKGMDNEHRVAGSF